MRWLVLLIALSLQYAVAELAANKEKTTHVLDFDIKSAVNEDKRRIISINGHNDTFGPTIRVKAGDVINLKVQNHICTTDETQLGTQDPLWRDYCNTALHFHGLIPIGNENDGVPGIVQDAIRSGGIYWYNFTVPADSCGTFWYHSHSTVQYGDGLRGAMIVECPMYDLLVRQISATFRINEIEAPGPFIIDEGGLNPSSEVLEEQVVTLSDYYTEFNLDVMRNKVMAYDGTTDPHIDGSLINGFEKQDTEFTLETETEFLVLRVINSGMSGTQILHLEGHKMIIMETDGILVKPYTVDTLSMAVGQRTTVVVPLSEDVKNGESALRMVNGCNKMMGYVTKTAWFAKKGGANTRSSTQVSINRLPGLNKQELYHELEPHDSEGIFALWGNQEDVQRVELEYSYHSDDETKQGFHTGMYKVNGKVFDEYLAEPIVLQGGQVAEIVINAKDHMRHPWHLHGQPFQVVSLGAGREGPLHLDSLTTAAGHRYQDDLQFWQDNSRAPMTRDSINIPGNSYAALRIKSEYEGKWLFHCHVDWHMAKGLGVVLQVLPSGTEKGAQSPNTEPETTEQSPHRFRVLLVYFFIMLAINAVLYKLLM